MKPLFDKYHHLKVPKFMVTKCRKDVIQIEYLSTESISKVDQTSVLFKIKLYT